MPSELKSVTLPALEPGTRRTIYLIDIENICGMSNPTGRAVKNARRMILAVMSPNSQSDIFVLGCDPVNAKSAKIGFPEKAKDGTKTRFGIAKSGKDGGDKALLFWIDQYLGEVRDWHRIVVCSGDGIFSDICRDLRSRGARLFLISRSRISSSQKLSDVIPKRFRFYLEDIDPSAAFSSDKINETQLKKALKKYFNEKWKNTKQKNNKTASHQSAKSVVAFGSRRSQM